MTPLEALSAGVPPVVLDTPVAREVYGDAAVFVARGDIAGTAAALRRLLTEPAQRGAHPGIGARRPRAVFVGHGRGPHARAPREDRPGDDASPSSSSPTTPATISPAASSRCIDAPPSIAARHHGRRQRLDRWRPRPRAAPLAGRPRPSPSSATAASPPATTPAFGRRAASCCSCSTATPWCRRAPSTRSWLVSRAHPDGGRGRPAPDRRRRAARSCRSAR